MSEEASVDVQDTGIESQDAEMVDDSNEMEAQPQDSDNEEIQEEAKEPVSRKRKINIKVDGQEEEVEFDPDNEEELRKHLQLSRAAMKKMSEAAKTKKQAEMFIEQLKSDPKKVLSNPNLGLDFRQIAEEYLYEQIQRESMSPEEIEYNEKMERLKKYEEQEKTSKQQAEEARVQAMQQKYVQSYDKTITDALQSSGLPKTPATVKRMAMLLSKNLDMGLDLDPSDLVGEVKKSYFSEFKEMFSQADADFILSILGDDISNKIRKKDLEKLVSFKNNAQSTQRNADVPEEQQEKGYMTPDEYKEWLKNR